MKRAKALERLADEELMPLVARKDPAAFEVFYDRHGAAAYSLAYRIVGDPTGAEDITQEALLAIWRSQSGYDPARGSVRSWVLGVVRNRAIDAFRRESSKRMPKLELEGGAELEARPAPEQTDAEALRRETAREVRGVLRELPEEQSKVIELAFFAGFTHSQIAELLGLPIGTVKGRMRLGLEKIRANLAEAVS